MICRALRAASLVAGAWAMLLGLWAPASSVFGCVSERPSGDFLPSSHSTCGADTVVTVRKIEQFDLALEAENVKVAGLNTDQLMLLERLRRVRSLHLDVAALDEAVLEKVAALGTLERLEIWRVAWGTSPILRALSKSKSLKTLCIRLCTGWNDAVLAGICTITSLQEVDLSHIGPVSAKALAGLEHLPQLQKLVLWGSDILADHNCAFIAELKSLRQLTIWASKPLGGVLVSSVSKLPLIKLALCDMGSASLSDWERLSKHETLEDLEVSPSCRESDKAVAALLSMRKLRRLTLWSSWEITGNFMLSLGKNDTLQELVLFDRFDKVPESKWNAATNVSLRKLVVWSPNVAKGIVPGLPGWANLSILELDDGSELSRDDLSTIFALPAITDLTVRRVSKSACSDDDLRSLCEALRKRRGDALKSLSVTR